MRRSAPLLRSSAPSTVMAMRDPYLDALEQLDQMRDRAFEAEATIQRVRDACVSSHVDDKGKKVVFLDRIQRALDGDIEW